MSDLALAVTRAEKAAERLGIEVDYDSDLFVELVRAAYQNIKKENELVEGAESD